MARILPLIFLLFGTALGAGAGVLLMPAVQPAATAEGETAPDSPADGPGAPPQDTGDSEYIRMNNQFVVPVVAGDRVSALVVLSISLGVAPGRTADVYAMEPKLRDLFLQVLFDHANMGGFDGAFTRANTLDVLRMSLLETAQKTFGSTIREILILDIARQDA